MLDTFLAKTRKLIPTSIFRIANPLYHRTLAFIAACVYRFPSRHIKVIAVTGTKGKSSTVEIINAILEEAGYKTALTNTIRFKIGGVSSDNLYKMSMPGRFFMQKFLRDAVRHKCDYAVLEMTSQGAITYRHLFIDMDAFVFTNISPEHIEAHGSYENYLNAKISIAKRLGLSGKKNRVMIANGDDKEVEKFLDCDADQKMRFHISDVKPYEIQKDGLRFTFGTQSVSSHLSGLFNLYNILAAITTAQSQGVSNEIIIRAIEKFNGIKGRVELIDAGQDFKVVVDYAHTPDSLEKVYQVFQSSRCICILGGTGGGRDTWKRAEMGRIADEYCDEVILTDEDPYDENPRNIVDDVAKGMTHPPTIIMDRRLAIKEGIERAKTGDVVIITGKGTDPYIMGPQGTKTPWSDAKVAREEIEKIL
ncbi:MAG TPA: UDP-N-acetylmuramyl-tripeptide synthetase [Candidatus Paceibacterota bacterium]|jgi:UDP-N-acetylmuramoyl-L-alanyl-D-glutamate--2,6-diaminopimelate ligase|nr:UDP-N-acetylmuramyl-tripeptide synthetase [Candidatus Paceibacterota bacterium]